MSPLTQPTPAPSPDDPGWNISGAPVANCTHKIPHVHGHHTTRRTHHCDCPACRHAAYRVSKAYTLGRTVPDDQTAWVDATQAATLIAALQWAGVTSTQIADHLGISRQRVWQLGTNHHPRVSRHTVHALQALARIHNIPTHAPLPGAGLVDATGIRRRLQALTCLGWSARQISHASGVSRKTVEEVRAGRTRQVRPATAGALTRAWRTMARQTPPDTPTARQVRALATHAGWAPPLAWETDADMDNPYATPNPTYLRNNPTPPEQDM